MQKEINYTFEGLCIRQGLNKNMEKLSNLNFLFVIHSHCAIGKNRSAKVGNFNHF
jgi:hypothetical protein